MNSIITSTGSALGAFALIFITGFTMSHFGKPYGSLLFNIHKLIGLAFGIFLAVRVYRLNQAGDLSPMEVGLLVLAAVLLIGTGILGGLLNIDKPWPGIILKLHHILPYVAVITTISLIYLISQE